MLGGLVDDLDVSGGRVALVRGEAGIGKSALITRFVSEIEGRAHVLVGACDDLLTPQELGPVWDVARRDRSVGEPLSRGDLRGVMEALLNLLSRKLRPTVLVFEDTQWADEATLDVIKFLGRRIARTNGVLVLTYRDGEVDADHPLRQVFGELPPRNLVRVPLGPLSADAIADMVAEVPFDPEVVLALTGGNPLFVTEVIASGIDAVPTSVRDSVLARAGKVSLQTRRILQLVAVAPGGAERSVVDGLLDPTPDQLNECVQQGFLVVGPEALAFRHELQRRAIESSLTAEERRRLNQEVLAALGDQDARPARLVHHAQEAGDIDAMVAYAPQAARAAMSIDSHREAVAHFRVLEPHLDRFDRAELAAILDDWAREESYLDDDRALDLAARAITVHRSVGDDVALAQALTFAVRMYELHGRPTEAEACGSEAVTILESHPSSAALAAALAQLAWLRLMRGDDDALGMQLADRAIEIAETVDDDLTVTRALTVKGSILHSSPDGGGLALVEEAHRRAIQGAHRFEEVYALINLAGLNADVRDVARAADLARRARDTAARHEIRPLEAFAQAMYAEILLWQGDWSTAQDTATAALGSDPHAEAVAWRILGLIQARRGRVEASTTLQRMWTLAETSGQLQATDPAAATLAEHMWLVGDEDPERLALLGSVIDEGLSSGFVWPSGALAFWAWKLGILNAAPPHLPAFYRSIIEGHPQTAADFWESRGVPYEQALALMHGDEQAQLQAIQIFEGLGATATANRVRRALLDQGVRAPRGKGLATRDHAAGLTARQAEVLDLLAQGLSNPQIADRLFISHRTAENHVAAVLMKLDAPDRHAAVDIAYDRELITQD